MDKNDPKAIHFILPNLFTALNIGCGFFAIIFAFKGQFYQACLAIGIGAIFDLFDGKVARWTGTQSAFGEQFDSLSDLISFGLAPALIFYIRFLSESGRAGIILAFIYLLCGALRLARFNVNLDKVSSDYFQGLPIPGAALALISFILFSLETQLLQNRILCMLYIGFYAILMISTLPFFSLKKTSWISKHKKKVFILILLVAASILVYEEVMLFGLMNLYVIGSILAFLANRKKFKQGIIDLDDEEFSS